MIGQLNTAATRVDVKAAVVVGVIISAVGSDARDVPGALPSRDSGAAEQDVSERTTRVKATVEKWWMHRTSCSPHEHARQSSGASTRDSSIRNNVAPPSLYRDLDI